MQGRSLALVAVLALACDNELTIRDAGNFSGTGEKPDLAPPEKTDEITQVTKPEVDILWVIDNSGSMADEQAKLAENFPAFMEFFLESGLDYHIGVTSTDTTGSGLNGALRSVGTYRYITPDVQDPVAIFGQMAQLGASGSADEQASAAAYRAIEMPAPKQQNANAGFYRDDASLHLIVVTDEPDSSYTFGSGFGQTVPEFISWLNQKKNDADIPVSFSAIAGPVPGGCQSSGGGAFDGAEAGTPYHTIVAGVGQRDADGRTPGQFFSICQEDWTELLENLGLLASALRREYFLSEVPTPGTITVVVETPDGAIIEGIDVATLPEPYDQDDVDFACEELGAAACFEFLYKPARNSIELPSYVPPPQSKIRINYELLSGQTDGEDFEFSGDSD